MDVVEHIAEVRSAVATARRKGATIGFVPTMGALHAGHRSLIDAARRECGFVVVSIFVNPTQFAPHEDLARYPRPKDADLALCGAAGADLVFYPPVDVMYPSGAVTFVEVAGLSSILEGAIRPTHFRGVATVVTKLFAIVQPDVAYFGLKDFQQQVVIRTLTRDLNLPVEIRSCATIRDPDGLALSSRNAYLSPAERAAGLCLSRALAAAAQQLAEGITSPRRLAQSMQDLIRSTPGVQLDYAVVADPETLAELDAPQKQMVGLVAARVGSTRLIDNAVWTLPVDLPQSAR